MDTYITQLLGCGKWSAEMGRPEERQSWNQVAATVKPGNGWGCCPNATWHPGPGELSLTVSPPRGRQYTYLVDRSIKGCVGSEPGKRPVTSQAPAPTYRWAEGTWWEHLLQAPCLQDTSSGSWACLPSSLFPQQNHTLLDPQLSSADELRASRGQELGPLDQHMAQHLLDA